MKKKLLFILMLSTVITLLTSCVYVGKDDLDDFFDDDYDVDFYLKNDSRYSINDWFIESTNSKHTRLYSNDRPLYSGERGHIHDVPPHRYWVHITLRGFDEYITDKIDIYDDVIYYVKNYQDDDYWRYRSVSGSVSENEIPEKLILCDSNGNEYELLRK